MQNVCRSYSVQVCKFAILLNLQPHPSQLNIHTGISYISAESKVQMNTEKGRKKKYVETNSIL